MDTIFVIPPECHIGGHTVRIRISEKYLDIADLAGESTMTEGIIRLSLHLDNKPRSRVCIFETLIHEIIHLVDREYVRDGALEERQVGCLANGIVQALLSMGIEPDFSKIPDEE